MDFGFLGLPEIQVLEESRELAASWTDDADYQMGLVDLMPANIMVISYTIKIITWKSESCS